MAATAPHKVEPFWGGGGGSISSGGSGGSISSGGSGGSGGGSFKLY